MNSSSKITSKRIPVNQRVKITAELFGLAFPMRLEPTIFNFAGNLAAEYDGGYWEFYKLSNGGFFMCPTADTPFHVRCENGFEGELSAEAFGIVCSMYVFSNFSFSDGAFAETCAQHYHWLREYALDHAEAGSIMQAID
jgi:hypothetical protein